jgi:hypothetical protein
MQGSQVRSYIKELVATQALEAFACADVLACPVKISPGKSAGPCVDAGLFVDEHNVCAGAAGRCCEKQKVFCGFAFESWCKQPFFATRLVRARRIWCALPLLQAAVGYLFKGKVTTAIDRYSREETRIPLQLLQRNCFRREVADAVAEKVLNLHNFSISSAQTELTLNRNGGLAFLLQEMGEDDLESEGGRRGLQ